MAESMMERIAKAVRTYGVRIYGQPWVYAVVGEDFEKPIVDGLTAEEAYAKAAELNARAAIDAMREPTEAMQRAGFANNRHVNREPCDRPTCIGAVTMPADRAWRAMIDAILSEPKPGDAR